MRSWTMLPVCGAILLVSACGTKIQDLGGSGGDNGAGGAGGTGGQGGSSSTAPPTCATDCTQIVAPTCFRSECDEATLQCVVVPDDGAPCNDGQFCTVNDSCEAGICTGGPPNTCEMTGDQCHFVACDEDTDSCSLQTATNGQACAAEDLCTVNASCQNGLCIGTQKDCFFAPVPDECFVAVCNPANGMCEPQPGNDGAACPTGGDLCLVNKICLGGVCQGGVPVNCSAFTNGCNNGMCDPVDGSCYSAPVPPGGTCLEATDACNTGICDNAGKCLPTPSNDGGTCNDGNSCTMGETCLSGMCQGGVVGNYEVYFTETFASNAAGWTLGTEWQIGPAQASSGGFPSGFEDPANDHTASADNGIAGVVIGGYANKVIHPAYYLTSPVIDTSAVPASLYLEFYRYLNSDYTRYMKNTIDVYDGVQWVNVWASGSFPGIQDSDWIQISHDLTAYKNPNMQIRFGFEIGSGGVFTVSSWNIDDVVLANQVCGP